MKNSVKRLINLFVAAALILVVAACSDDEPTPSAAAPTIAAVATNPSSVTVGEKIQLSFDITVPGVFASSTATGTNGNAEVITDLNTGDTSGTIIVEFEGTTAGGGSVELTVNDAEGNSDDITVVLTVEAEATTVTVSSNITGTVTWETGKTYILAGRITVLDGAVLNIEKGVVVKGQAGTGANATALLVARGGTLNAAGEAEMPIIFTSIADEISPEDIAAGNFASPNLASDVSGLWGGVIILGKAKISTKNKTSGAQLSEVQIDGIPTSDTNGLYGGSDDEDNSGTITYISIRHGGSNIGSGNEINGLTLGGVGSGTTISNVEVVANQDDGIEFFGGTVSVTNAVVWNINDDGIDTDQAWNGKLENFVVIAPNTAEAHCFELDGPEGTYINGNHTITKGTVVATVGDRKATDLINVDNNTNATLSNIFITGISADQDINRTESDDTDVTFLTTFTGIELDIPAGSSLADYVSGNVPAGITAASTPSTGVGADLSAFAWTWASTSTEWPGN
ncbi:MULTISPECIES: hypothetical protein [Roseivirga]|uniref:hypothetical protein n=1 Tax=Roseivirga TaxID=290180 RepID=UPI000AC0258B|nr:MULTISPECIES: hypothetical protein [Roseivirga]MBO6661280.1 hypothetical protein [Roseivirga sp.]MBO6908736.1 hypothetical protein [Roseivirga sp.]WPZ11636.1 hypothetical protein T7867_05900 [Roseivirga spongicola]